MLDKLKEIARACDGEIKEIMLFPGGHGCATMEIPLRKDHWIYTERLGLEPPMPFKMGISDLRDVVAEKIREAGKYALLASSYTAAEVGFDPDAFLQNLVVGLLGYWTDDGLSKLD